MANDDPEKINNSLEKNSKILVTVDEVLADIIVVTYTYEQKLFQGVLLDASKRNLPYGVNKLNPAFTTPINVSDSPSKTNESDKLYAVSQRFNYQDRTFVPVLRRPSKTQKNRLNRNNRMTVRLRPRQVLCSKCRGICNENSENVDNSSTSASSLSSSSRRKRKNDDSTVSSSNLPSSTHDFNTRLQAKEKKLFAENQSNNQTKQNNESSVLCPSLIPRLSRLQPKEISEALGGTNKIKIMGKYIVKPSISTTQMSGSSENEDPLALPKDPLAFTSADFDEEDKSNEEYCQVSEAGKLHKRMVLRKKKSVGSMEDLWDESVFEENCTPKDNSDNGKLLSEGGTRTLKISFGPEGEGTVLKIPKILTTSIIASPAREEQSVVVRKAAKRALKKAKKEAARRKVFIASSPVYNLNGSPRYTTLSSPRYSTLSSPRYTTGATSPRYTLSATDSTLIPRRHKHKVKHKKKHHRDDRKSKIIARHPISAASVIVAPENDPLFIPETYTAIKERCLKQKLSISLKRLTENLYSTTKIGEEEIDKENDKGDEDKTNLLPYSHSDVDGDVENEDDDDNETTPDDFPPISSTTMHSLLSESTSNVSDEAEQRMYQVTTTSSSPITTTSTTGIDADGNRLEVGDVVWGKIHGFPWWPGKILSISISSIEDKPQAHVAWYGSSTSSLMPCDQLSPFLENFKTRYNKKKRGPYKEAIRQATSEAKNEQEPSSSSSTSSTSSSSTNVPPTIVPLVSPPMASPREIDVAS